jgi:hypothetical protein
METYIIVGATEYQSGVAWTSLPGRVDGTETATLRWTTRERSPESTPTGEIYTATITTESGVVSVSVTTR